MKSKKLPEDIVNKVRAAARNSFEEYSSELAALQPDKLFKTAYLHGFNCAYNIYDVAEEKIEELKQNSNLTTVGERPVKDVPEISENVLKYAESSLASDNTVLCNTDKNAIYTKGYESGFSKALTSRVDSNLYNDMNSLIDYYLFGKK